MSAAKPKVKSVSIVLSRQADAPVVSGLMRTKAGASYDPEAVAGDLYRMAVLGYAVVRFEARFDADGAAMSLTASHTEKPSAPRLESVELTGGVAAIDEACRSLRSQRPSTLSQRRRLDYLGMLRDAQVIEREYRARGRLNARVTGIIAHVSGDGKSARLRFTLKPGKQFMLGKVAVKGNQKIEAEELIQALKIEGRPPWTDALRFQIVHRALQFCRERGYLDARVDGEPEKQPAGTVNLRIDLTEGDRGILNQAVIQGAETLKPKVAKLITFRKGEPIAPSTVEKLRQAIEDLGHFSSVEMLFVPLRDQPAGHRDLVIRLSPVALGRDIGAAEKLYYEMAQNVVRLYNQGKTGLRSIRISGFTAFDGGTLRIDAAIVRPDYARVRVVLSPGAAAQEPRPKEISFFRDGTEAAVYLSPLGTTVNVPASLAVKFALEPPEESDSLFTEVQLAPGVVKDPRNSDVVLLGERCPPAAVYFTRHAKAFARKPPKLTATGLVLPDASGDGGATKILLDADKLPRRVMRLDKKGADTARFDIEINPKINRKREPKWAKMPGHKEAATGLALMAPALRALGLSDAAAELADRAVAEHPKDPGCVAARGLVRTATGPPGPGLADLRAAAATSRHPGYALLLAETLIRGRRFADARAVCQKLLAAGPPQPRRLEAADIILAASMSLRSAVDRLMTEPDDYRRRARVDCALAHIGLREYRKAAELARQMLRDRADDAQATELLARCELSLGNPKAALGALAKLKPNLVKAEPDIYAALAHHMLGEDTKAARALARGMKKSWTARNLLLLQSQAAEIHPRFRDAAAKAALARVFSRAAGGELTPDRKKKLAAVVNDSYVLRADVDKLAKQFAGAGTPNGGRHAKLWAAARRKLIEDTLIFHWAMWSRVVVLPADVQRAIDAEMKRLGVADMEDYRKLLEKRGTSVAERRGDIFKKLLKRQAFSAVLSDKVMARPSEVRAYYQGNPKQFTAPPSARFRMITLHFVRFREKHEAVKLAGALLRRLKAKPETFEQLARQYSHDANAARGGLWENVTKGSMFGPLDKAIFGMKPGQTSDVIQTDRGCHIIRAEKMLPERMIPLEEAAPRIVRAMQQIGARAEIAVWIQRLRAESYVELFDQ